MKIKKQDYDDVSVIELQGDLDHESTEMLQNSITEVIGTARTGIVLDMNKLDSVDSIGLEQLLWVRDYCDANNCQLRMAGPSETLLKILEMTRLDGEFDSYCELADAVKSFA